MHHIPSPKIEKQIKEYFKRKYNIKLSDWDYMEVSDSLYHLGKAIFLSQKYQIKHGTSKK